MTRELVADPFLGVKEAEFERLLAVDNEILWTARLIGVGSRIVRRMRNADRHRLTAA